MKELKVQKFSDITGRIPKKPLKKGEKKFWYNTRSSFGMMRAKNEKEAIRRIQKMTNEKIIKLELES